ncbi:hypothetical protein GCM10008018_22160 [Paenibacillus marchantiophytorum]|uniref:Response regulatory domain-containing protein n=1 Tax=Paenibacillus marchantiophytorum TaxID=1619310 RepID=A0ABQ1EKZ8_9BACL|nr:response regulator [Paenibacillus marchantiophytorum]GFZ76384.1 hypothetical protein GCM10008018_22160 [Paenibacillus marchantiophytorum]
MYTIMLVDDEQPALQRLRLLLEKHTDLQVSGLYTKPSEALAAASKEHFDAAFLDIEMPGMNGLQLASELTQTYPAMEVIMVTAYNEYALQAFRANAIDYLLKPVDTDDLIRAVQKLKKRLSPILQAPPKTDTTAAHITGLGGFEVYPTGQEKPLRFQTAKAEELFAYMLAHVDNHISKWVLCEQLWPDNEPVKAEQNLHTCVHRLKKTLTESVFPAQWHSQRGSYRMTLGEQVKCDWLTFEQAADNAVELSGLTDHQPNIQIERLEQAVSVYKGGLFGGKDYRWCEPLRERLQRKFADTAKALSQFYRQLDKATSAIELLHRLGNDFPYDEDVQEQILEHYLRKKDRSAFLLHYGKIEAALRDGLNLQPSERIARMHKQMTAMK